jgi:hypothetical protein
LPARAGRRRGGSEENGDQATRTRFALSEALFFLAEQRRKDADASRFPEYDGAGDREDVMRHINGE